MSRISKAERQLQLQREEAGDHLYANRVRVYPKSVHGPVRNIKWAVLIVCLGIYYLLPWLRWHRGVNQPDQQDRHGDSDQVALGAVPKPGAPTLY